MCNNLFVYGTLLQGSGHSMAQLLHRHCAKTGRGKVPGSLFDCGDYPGAIADPAAKTFVHGTLCEIDDPDRVFPLLDRYEGFFPQNPNRSLFLRVLTQVHFGKIRHEAWIYVYNQSVEGLKLIPGGDYLAFLKTRGF